MADKIASLFVEIGADVSKFAKGMTGVKDNLKSATISADGMKKAALGVAGVLDTVAVGLTAQVKKWEEYGWQVGEITRLTGMSAEETSKLLQVVDDTGISYDSLKTAMEGAVKKGVDPSIESLMSLSDQYLALEPGLERATFLNDNFGRSGEDLARFMELGSTAIKANSEAVDENLILTEDAAKKAEAFRVAQDNLKDSVDGVSYSLSEKYAPALTTALTALTQLLNWGSDIQDVYQKHSAEVVKTTGSYEDYAKEMLRAGVAAGYLNQNEMDLVTSAEDFTDTADAWSQDIGYLTEQQYEMAKAALEAAGGISAQTDAINKMSSKTVTITTNYVTRHINASDPTRTYPLAGGYATGGDFTVPAGFNADNYSVGVKSGEKVSVTPTGQQSSTDEKMDRLIGIMSDLPRQIGRAYRNSAAMVQ